MYQIFLSLALIISQNQIDHAKGYSWKSQNFVQKDDNKEFKNENLKRAQKIEIASGNDPFSDQDIISQLKREVAIEEEALAPDLESLGLDEIDPLPKTAQTKDKKDIVVETPKVSKEGDKKEVKDNKGDVKKDIKTPEPKKESAALNIPDSQRLTKKESENKTTPEVKKPNPPKIPQDKIKDEDSKSGFNPINKIKNLFKKESDISQPPKLDAVKIKPKTSAEDKKTDVKDIILESKKEGPSQEEIEKKNEEARQKRIELEELKEGRRMEKMQAIRKKYLRQSDEDIFEGVGQYQIMSQIVPQEKILPKFINKEVPPPLLSRLRSNDNRHHPFLMTSDERVDFMFRAIARNTIDEFNSLYALNPDPDAKNQFGDTLLTFATVMGRYDAIASLLAKGANPDAANDLGYTPLNIAIEIVDYKSVEILIDMGARFDSIDSLGRTYLMQAARIGSLQIVDLLISKGVDVNVEDYRGDTALSIAFKFKKDIVAKYLAKFGAKSFIKKEYKKDNSSMIEEIFEKWR